MSLPADYTPNNLDHARGIIADLLARVEQLKQDRAADDKEMTRLVERSKEDRDYRNEVVEKYNDLHERHAELSADIDKTVTDSMEAWEAAVEKRLDEERASLERRREELDAREVILHKRYGSRQPRGRPPQYSTAQMLQVRDLLRSGMNMAAIAREINLTPRQVRHMAKHHIPNLKEKGEQQRAAEFTPLYRKFQTELKAWAKVLPDHRYAEAGNAISNLKFTKGYVVLMNTEANEAALKAWLGRPYSDDMPARLVLAADRLDGWMRVNKAVWG